MIECPKCKYVRQADDFAPEGECPKCGIIYSKFMDHQSGYHDHHEPAFENEQSSGPRTGHKGAAIALVLLCLLALVVFGAYRFIDGEHEEGVVEEGGVVIYTSPNCRYCKLAKAYLDKNNIDYAEYDVTTSKEANREFKKLNGRGVPLIRIGDKVIKGFNKKAIKKALEDEGFL